MHRSSARTARRATAGASCFVRVDLPPGAQIAAAHLELVQKYQSGPVGLEIRGEASHQADDFGPGSPVISSRARTHAHVAWELAGPAYGWVSSPDIAAIVQEIVDGPGWWPGNNLAIFVDPQSGAYTTWLAFDAEPQFAARLVVSYELPQPPASATPTATATAAPSETPTATPQPSETPTQAGSMRIYLPLIVN